MIELIFAVSNQIDSNVQNSNLENKHVHIVLKNVLFCKKKRLYQQT